MDPPPPKLPTVAACIFILSVALFCCAVLGPWPGIPLGALNLFAAYRVWCAYQRAVASYIDMQLVRLKFLNSNDGRAYTFALVWCVWAGRFKCH
jgi:hypothetical protein